MKARLQIMQYDSEMAIAHQPFSAGVMDADCNEMLSELRAELEDEKAEHSVTKAYIVRLMMPTTMRLRKWPN